MIAAAAVCGVLSAKPAEAVTFSYYTAGCFNAPACDPFTSAGALALIGFIPAGSAATPLTADEPTTISLGLLTTQAAVSGGTFTASPFDLFVVQSAPSGGVGQIVAEINGKITPTSSGADVTFTTPSITIGGVQYTIADNPLHLPSPSTIVVPGLPAFTSIQADVTFTAVAEPATMTMFGSALFGLFVRARRKAQGGREA